MTLSPSLHWPGFVVAVAAMTFTGNVHGQHALDANLQVGSGGINQPRDYPDFAARNQIIYGNVSGLGYFRDTIGSGAPGDFRDQLGSDDLFRFRASTQSPMVGGVGTGRLPGLTPQPVQRGFSAPISHGPGAHRYDQIGSGWRGTNGLSGQTFDPRRAVGEQHSSLIGVNTIGQVQTTDGQFSPVTAQPMIGIGIRNWQTPRTQEEVEEIEPEIAAQPSPMLPGMMPGAIDATRRDVSMRLGAQLGGAHHRDWRIQARTGETIDEQVERIRASVLAIQGSREARPGDDVYMDMLVALRQREEVLSGRTADRRIPQDSLVRVEQPEDEARAQPDTATRPALREPTDEELSRAEQARIEATRRALGLATPRTDEAERVDEAEEDATERRLPEAMARLLATLDHDLAPLGTLAGRRDDPTTRLMRQAESLLAEGRYFDAERAFGGILAVQEDRPLARVGLVHSQIGAGLLQTAGLNLRRLIADHPELIATRYELRLLPTEARLDWAERRLRDMAEREHGEHTGLVLAYIGFQTRSERLVRLGMDVFETASPTDPLIPLLRRVWLADRD
ncbi:MAG: hypothetical protein JJU36_00690 [Phycisphaeraceae bacterium]|nr:hypothetical protein [Phycisphaeraceae bacterium]